MSVTISSSQFLYNLYSHKGIGCKTIVRLCNKYGSFNNLKKSFESDEELSDKLKFAIKKSLINHVTLPNNIITFWDDYYPIYLKEIPDAPIILYFQGNIDLLHNPKKVSMVGARKHSDYGAKVTSFFVRDAVQSGFITVSGMAIGIDALVHKHTIENGGKTIAVLGSPLENPQPGSNYKLFKSILKHDGLVLSEYKPNTIVEPRMFPQRNRIIAGLSMHTIVIEASNKSGSLITAKLAADYNRNVYSAVNSIFIKGFEGNYDLIMSNIANIITKFSNINNNQLNPDNYEELFQNIDEKSRIIVTHIINNKNIDNELANIAKLTLKELYNKVFELEMSGVIAKDVTGKYTIRF